MLFKSKKKIILDEINEYLDNIKDDETIFLINFDCKNLLDVIIRLGLTVDLDEVINGNTDEKVIRILKDLKSFQERLERKNLPSSLDRILPLFIEVTKRKLDGIKIKFIENIHKKIAKSVYKNISNDSVISAYIKEVFSNGVEGIVKNKGLKDIITENKFGMTTTSYQYIIEPNTFREEHFEEIKLLLEKFNLVYNINEVEEIVKKIIKKQEEQRIKDEEERQKQDVKQRIKETEEAEKILAEKRKRDKERKKEKVKKERKRKRRESEIWSKKKIGDLIKELGSPSINNRIKAVKYLGKLKDKKAVRPLMEALKDSDEIVVRNAVSALGAIGDPRALDDIRKISNRKDCYWETKETCIRSIAELEKIKFERMAKVVESDLKSMSWQDFEDAVTDALNAVPSDTRTSDMGIDGITSDGILIQIKQSERIGRNVVDNFETALRRYYPSNKKNLKGIIVAFSFTTGAYTEVERAKREDKIYIKLIIVDELVS